MTVDQCVYPLLTILACGGVYIYGMFERLCCNAVQYSVNIMPSMMKCVYCAQLFKECGD